MVWGKKREYLKVRKNARKKQKIGFSNSNSGSFPAKIINLLSKVFAKKHIEESTLAQSFWPINGQGFSYIHKFHLDNSLSFIFLKV